MTATTILKLPVQPLPVNGLAQPVAVTIWFLGCIAFVVAFYRLLGKRAAAATAPEFRLVYIGTALLTL